MNSLKKIVAGLSALTIVLTQSVSLVAFGATFPQEELTAHQWGYDNGLTSKATMDEFMPYASLQRQAFAKFISEFAMKFLNKTPDTTKMCDFNDKALFDSTLTDSICKAYQMNLMMGSNGNFMAEKNIIRGDVMRVMYRLLKGEMETSVSQAYNYLNSMGIFNVLNENDNIMRSHMMLVLYRTYNQLQGGSFGDIFGGIFSGNTNSGNQNTGAVVAGDLNVMLDSSTPASNLLVPRTAKAQKVAVFKISAGASDDVTINEVLVGRSLAGNTSDIENVYLYLGDAQRITDGRTVSSNTNEARFSNLGLVVKKGTSILLTVRVDFNSTAGSRQHAFSIKAMTSTARNVSGLPVTGNPITLGDVTVGAVSINSRSVATTEVSVGSQSAELAKINVQTNSVETATLRAITLALAGNLSAGNIKNLKLVNSNGTVLATADMLKRVGTYDAVTFVLSTGGMMDRGGDITLSVQGDVVGGRNGDKVGFYLSNATDLLLEGGTFGSNLSVNTGTSSNAYYQDQSISSLPASTLGLATTSNFVTVKAGKLTFTYLAPNAQNVARGTNDVVLGAFNINNQSGQPVDIRTLAMTLSGNTATSFLVSGGIATFTNIRLVKYENNVIGSILGSVSDPATADVGPYAMNFRDVFSVNAGDTKVAVIANIPSSVAIAGSYKVYFNPSSTSNSFRGTVTSETITDVVPSSNISSNISTLIGSALTVNYGSTPATSVYVRGQEKVNIGSVVFNASDAVDTKLNAVTVQFLSGTTAFSGAQVAHTIYIYDGSTLLGGASTRNFDAAGVAQFYNLNLSIPRGTSKTLTIKGDILNNAPVAASNFYKVSVTAVDATQSANGSSISTSVPSATNAGTFGLATGGTITITNALVNNQLIPGSKLNATFGSFRIRANSLPFTVKTLTFAYSGQVAAPVVGSFKLVDTTTNTVISSGGTLIGSGASVGIIRFNALNFAIAQDTEKTVEVRADINNISSSQFSGIVNTNVQFGVYLGTGDSQDNIEFVPSNAVGLASLKDVDYSAGNITLTGGTPVVGFNSPVSATLFANALHTMTRTLPVVTSVSSDQTYGQPLVVTITNPSNDTIYVSGLRIGLTNSSLFSAATCTWEAWDASQNSAFTGNNPMANCTGLVSLRYLNNPGLPVAPNTTIKFKLNLITASYTAQQAGRFYVKPDSNSTLAGSNFFWTDNINTFNGYTIYAGSLDGKSLPN